MEDLMEQIRLENGAYRAGKPIVTDPEYDIHLSELVEQMTEDDFNAFLETLMEEAGDIDFGDYVVGSLKKLKYEKQELAFWLAKMNILVRLFVSAKIDGVSFVAKYRNGKYSSCSSRGDGAAGTDWTEKGSYILPATIPCRHDVDVRGEFTLTGDSHKILGFKNRRNGTSGIMNSGDVDPEKLKYVKGYTYQILNPEEGCEKISAQFEDLGLMGFLVAPFIIIGKIDPNIEETLKEQYLLWEKELPFDIDGEVISSADWKNENDKFFPTTKFAYKINSEGIPVTVIGVEWNLSQTRYMKPVVLLDPTEIDGTTVQRATGYNAKYILDNGIKTGTVVSLIKSGKIIPKIIGIVSH